MYKVTFSSFSKVLNKYFPEVETAIFATLADARLRACALGWTIAKVEKVA